MLISMISERDYSAQEAVHLLMGWPVFEASRKLVTLPLYYKRWNTGEIYTLDCPLFPNLIEMCLSTHRLILFDFLLKRKIFFIMINPCQSPKNI